MMHTAILPVITKKRLTEVLFLQLRLLRWAATAGDVREDGCRAWLQSVRRYRGQAKQIAAWVWGSENRYGPLERFAQGPVDAKRDWVRRLTEEAHRVLRCPRGGLQPFFEEQNAEDWQKEGAAFLRRFYEEFRGRGFPALLFCNPGDGPLSGQTFLDAFLRANGHLCVCPACDESSFHTVARGSIRAEIDHYLPKSVYPHLAIHPFNLIPLCHACNSWTKGDRDPLAKAGGRCVLEDIWLPYRREEGLSRRTYLVVATTAERSETQLGPIRPRESSVLPSWIESLSAIFDLPARWGRRTDMIGERLFRRMRGYLRIPFDTTGQLSQPEARGILEELLATMHDEDLGREPDVFVMLWWLAKLIQEEFGLPEDGSGTGGPLVEELRDWSKETATRAEALRLRGSEIWGLLVEGGSQDQRF